MEAGILNSSVPCSRRRLSTEANTRSAPVEKALKHEYSALRLCAAMGIDRHRWS